MKMVCISKRAASWLEDTQACKQRRKRGKGMQ